MKLIYLVFASFFIIGCSGCLDEQVRPNVVELIDPDSDGDGVSDDMDNCKFVYNPNQADSDCDGVGDACDVCPGINDLTDSDGDNLPDCKFPPASYSQVASHWKCGSPSLQKVKVCYKTPSGGFQTICTYYSAIHTHIRNGGFLGICGESSCNN